ncbi:MAG: GNAT family N-acetyltransferase [Planctomycetota bacterium]
MEIITYDPSMLEGLAAAYNRATSDLPHCYPVAEDTFEGGLRELSEDRKKDCSLGWQEVLVARDGNVVVGFVHPAIGRLGEDKADVGMIRFLAYDRGRRATGQALLAAAEARLRERGARSVQVCPQEAIYPFYYAEPAFLSGRLDHVQALLAFSGYAKTRGEVFLDWPDFEPREPEPSAVGADIEVERREKPGRRPDIFVRARVAGKEVGVCHSGSLAQASGASEADEWVFTHWLGVERDVQGKGLGRRLLRRALVEAHALGFRHAAISTSWDNHRAFLFYSNFGYHVMDWTYGYSRDLDEPPPDPAARGRV